LNDERLLIEAAQNDPSRFAELYEGNFHRVYAFVARRVKDREEAQDLTADVFAPAFLVVSIISAASAYFFWQMPDDAGHEISGRKAVEKISSRKGAEKAAVKAATEGTQDARDQRLG